MKRGEVWWVLVNPLTQSNVVMRKPAVIVSIDAANDKLNRVQMVPLGPVTENLYPCESLLHVHDKPHTAMADQIKTVSKLYLVSRIGKVVPEEMRALEAAIAVHLGIEIKR